MQRQFYPTVTPFEHSLLGKDWSEYRHLLVVRSGDGRFAKALRSVLPDNCRLLCLESREEIRPTDGPEVLGGEWDLPAVEREREDYGPFDGILLLHFHEYFEGRVGSLTRLAECLDPNGIFWVQFLNGSCLSVVDDRLRAGGLRGRSLSSPYYKAPPLDLQGVAHWGNAFGLVCDEVWGYAGEALYDWITGKRKKDFKLELLKRNYPVRTSLEGVGAGAHVLALRLRGRRFGETKQVQPRIAVAKMSPAGLQTFLIPHPLLDDRESDEWQARVQIKSWKEKGRPEVSPVRRRMLEEFVADESVRKVLLVGGAYGGDLLLLAALYDQWDWTGVDHDGFLVDLWKDRFPDEAKGLVSWDPSAPFPFEDDEFDLVLSLGAFSRFNPPLALRYVTEMIRVSRHHVAHLEDTTGPAHDSFKRTVPLPPLYERAGWTARTRPVLTEGKDTGWATVFIEKDRDRIGPHDSGAKDQGTESGDVSND